MERYDKQFTEKYPYGKKSLAKCPYGKVSSRRTVLTAKCPYVEVSVQQHVQSEMAYGKNSYGEKSGQGAKLLWPRRKLIKKKLSTGTNE